MCTKRQYGLLESIRSPRDLDSFTPHQLDELECQVRDFLIQSVAKTGGHLGSNLGVVELSIALHRSFRSPEDCIIFDVGHQCYVHKLITGRHDFKALRCKNGLSGYPSRHESNHDIVENSHASAALSWADGVSRARTLLGNDNYVIAVVGDGSLTGGMCWEALNNISDDNNRRLVIVVNDNGRSYARTIGGIARFLNAVRASKSYLWLRESSEAVFSHMGSPGRRLYQGIRGAIHGFLSRFSSSNKLFSNLDIRYLGPINGHNRKALEKAFKQAKQYARPIIVHVITEKGHGYPPALEDALDCLHTVGVIDPSTGKSASVQGQVRQDTWTGVFGEELLRLAESNTNIVAVTAAMLHPTGLSMFAEKFPHRVFDVGIAEQHAVASAAGLAYEGLHPVVAIYSTFMNRAFDQVMMDVALHGAPVTFVLDRAGITGPDGASHHGIWDLSLLRIVPGIKLYAPRDASTLRNTLALVCSEDCPTAIRFPRGSVCDDLPALRSLDDGIDVLYGSCDREDIVIVAIGVMAHACVRAAQLLAESGIESTVINPVCFWPLHRQVLARVSKAKLVVLAEEGAKSPGLGDYIAGRRLLEFVIPGDFQPQGSRDELLDAIGLNGEHIARKIKARFNQIINCV
ncbi:MAG: 1-deoxy-D-xylulose-5-phosphate synthase [Tropheryma whipplei]|uniref:1-deoxy-D-xylulose-5-phosphate synthase n=2 Tax=Tropheryma whipplei TaxID=2039 RepID=DXS_TROWT|nr:1-deoxy-D-xylulose-5-phosphate synthase [Tropheryma whipplei]Q83G46.1 RecName: Full=1-deoxy-D-xylulose-5-phosphate synthase; AltName: Full=1-deoxyxylulose-5-phosphate synthase; Short=DXP synthase; Short=DXPS [Tropheryma whipplei str. Twist]Q83I20.1 RecName: Full=1-deoxy-D-xylulose-5-phosphate synthase; AltName: Full=1-deoxyxylulose-5-phosphate synthase; Short=DXP synthase; Short=DXPS [Tropheryma whipplei TW08/27]AAO44581.1 1-deoxyxylulose-5-phosphate synthase [Tropheryma whipplei str. Twist]